MVKCDVQSLSIMNDMQIIYNTIQLINNDSPISYETCTKGKEDTLVQWFSGLVGEVFTIYISFYYLN